MLLLFTIVTDGIKAALTLITTTAEVAFKSDIHDSLEVNTQYTSSPFTNVSTTIEFEVETLSPLINHSNVGVFPAYVVDCEKVTSCPEQIVVISAETFIEGVTGDAPEIVIESV